MTGGSAACTTTWQVAGMTCGHCVSSVTEEIGEIAGVESVEVDLETGEVVVISAGLLDRSQVEAAVAEAGYALV